MLPKLISATANRFSLVSFGEAGCPVQCLAALPGEGDQEGPQWLPPAARPDSRRCAVGKGITRQEALESCLGEAVELMCTCQWGDEKTVRAAASELGDSSILPNDVLLISERQFAERAIWNSQYGEIAWLPEPLDPGQPIDWIEARTLADGRGKFVPAALALIGYIDNGPATFCVGNSNGCAAGPSTEDAILAGLLEVVERDATAIWWHGLCRRPGVHLDDLALGIETTRWLRDQGRSCFAIDIATDLGIPVFAAVSADAAGSGIVLGFGADLEPDRAVEKALTELCQQLLAHKLQEPEPGPAARWWRSAVSTITLPHLVPLGMAAIRPAPSSSLTGGALPYCLERCVQCGLEPAVIDFTRESLSVPVVRVVVAGMRPPSPAFAPGRLYDVPMRLGWPHQPEEDRLNRLPLVV